MGHERAQKTEYQLACEVGDALTASLDIDETLSAVARAIAEAAGVWECDLYAYYPESETIVAVAAWARQMTEADREWVGTVWSLAERPSYHRVLLEGQVDIGYIDDGDLEPLERELMAEWDELATLSAPLVSDGVVVGCMTLIHKGELRRFTAEDQELVALLAVPAAVAVDNARAHHRQGEQERHLGALLDSTRALTSAVVLEDVLGVVCREAVAAFDVAEAVIYEYVAAREEFVFRAIHQRVPSPAAQAQIGAVYAVDERPGDREMLHAGVIVEDRLSDPALDPVVRAEMERWGEKTCLNVPLLFEGAPVGELVLIEDARERHFDDDELALARAFAEQAAVAVVQSRFYRLQEEQNRRRLALLETSRSLAGSLDPEGVVSAMRRELTGLFTLPDEAVKVTLSDSAGHLAHDPGAPATSNRAPVGGLPRAALGGERILTEEPEGDTVRVAAPLVVHDAVEGVVELRFPAAGYGKEERELVQVLVGQAAAALANARLFREVEQQAVTDGLTGLYNHRHFYERLTQEFARAQRYGQPLSLLMLDLDDFKLFNDTHGHPAGDVVLAAVARVVRAQLFDGVDVAARYGGEEFAVLLPNTARDGAVSMGTRMVDSVAALADEVREIVAAETPRDRRVAGHAAGARAFGEELRRKIVAEFAGDAFATPVTVSVGAATYPGAASDPEELVRSADKALYLAKRMGKNRVEVFGD